MNRELIVNVNPTEISIALCEDKVLVELNKEQCQTGFAVGDIYLGKVRKIMPGLNAAFVNIGHEKDAFIHYLDLGSQFSSLQKLVASYQPGKRGIRLDAISSWRPMSNIVSNCFGCWKALCFWMSGMYGTSPNTKIVPVRN